MRCGAMRGCRCMRRDFRLFLGDRRGRCRSVCLSLCNRLQLQQLESSCNTFAQLCPMRARCVDSIQPLILGFTHRSSNRTSFPCSPVSLHTIPHLSRRDPSDQSSSALICDGLRARCDHARCAHHALLIDARLARGFFCARLSPVPLVAAFAFPRRGSCPRRAPLQLHTSSEHDGSSLCTRVSMTAAGDRVWSPHSPFLHWNAACCKDQPLKKPLLLIALLLQGRIPALEKGCARTRRQPGQI